MMRLTAVIWVGLLMAGLEAQPADTGSVSAAESAQRCLKQALADRQKGDIQGAIAQLRQALQLEPDFQDADGMLGELLLTQGFAEEALPHLQKAGNAYLQGLALLELKRVPEAVMKLLAADAQNPDNPDVLFSLGDASGTLMQRAYSRIALSHPGSPRALELQARNYLAQGRGDLAEQAFQNVLKLRPEMPGIHMELGRILQDQRGDLDGAEREYRSEVRMRPGNPEAAWRLGSVLLKKGQPKEALAELQRSDQLRPDMLDTLLDLGKAYLMENQIDPAEKAFRRILAIQDAGEVAAAAHLQLSQICHRKGLAEEAEQHLQRFRELSKGPGQQ
jgi:tetratricopeptide (TPR) repeat protein